MLNLGLLGYHGRMGQLISQAIEESKHLNLLSILTRDDSCWAECLKDCDVMIDFSTPQATHRLLEFAMDCPKPLVIGTTGLSQETHDLMSEVSKKTSIVYATNTSRGVTLLNHLAFLAAKILEDADIEIVEMHHHHKKDAPSGTAMTLAEHCARAREVKLEDVRVSGRDGCIGERDVKEIGVMSLRGGDIVGRHTVGFYCEGEYLEITHNATSRKTFALGALKAAQWIVKQPSGLYSMKDVLEQ